MASRGIIATYETIWQWTLKFGQTYANNVRRKQAKRGDKWFLDEVVLTIKGQHHYLWRAVDQDGFTLDILMQSWRNRHAARRFFRKLLKGLRYVPRVIITDKLKSYAAVSQSATRQVPQDVWFSDWEQGSDLWKMSRHYPRFDQTVSLLWLDDDDFPDYDAPRFRRGISEENGRLRELTGELPWPGKRRRR